MSTRCFPFSTGSTARGAGRRADLRRGKEGFTLVEMMAAIGVLMVLLIIIAMATSGARTTITRSQATVGAFAAARTAFENMTDKLSQATLNTYWDYYGYNVGSGAGSALVSRSVFVQAHGSQDVFSPVRFGRSSDLQFRIMQNSQQKYYGQEIYFQTPAAYSNQQTYQSTQGLMNSCSYFIQYCSDSSYRPTGSNILPGTTNDRWRYRLMQGLEPTESMSVYTTTSGATINSNSAGTLASATAYLGWQTNIQNNGTTLAPKVVPVADNVICLAFWPRLPLQNDAAGTGLQLLGCYGNTASFLYDSQADINDMFPSNATQQKVWDEQLPPIVEVTMIVIDEASAARIATNTSTQPAAIVTALTKDGAGSYTTATGTNTLANDLAATEASLNSAHINYRIMSTYIIMRESKWSTSSGNL